MTREEIITKIKSFCHNCEKFPTCVNTDKECFKSLETAIKAVEQEPCEDCISRKAVLDKIKEVCFSREQEWVDFRVSQGSNGQRDLIINFIEDLPSVQPKPKTGHWIAEENEEMETIGYYCSECDLPMETEQQTDFCPNCGARMVEPQEMDIPMEYFESGGK